MKVMIKNLRLYIVYSLWLAAMTLFLLAPATFGTGLVSKFSDAGALAFFFFIGLPWMIAGITTIDEKGVELQKWIDKYAKTK